MKLLYTAMWGLSVFFIPITTVMSATNLEKATQTTLLFASAQGQAVNEKWSTDLLGGMTKSLESLQQDKTIRRAEAELDREPSGPELRRYRGQMKDYHWTDDDSREYGRQGSQISRHEAEQIVRRAYREVLGREPDPGAQGWVDKILYNRWTEQDVVQALRDSDEYRRGGQISRQEAEQMVRRAYREVLGREPDAGAQGWVDKVLRDRWTEQDVVRALRDSDEYRRGGQISRQEAEQMVRRAYREVLGREPDWGAQGWVDKVLRDRWTEQDVVRALRDSEEYRSKRR